MKISLQTGRGIQARHFHWNMRASVLGREEEERERYEVTASTLNFEVVLAWNFHLLPNR
jgi:hypothetical protein